MTHKPCGASDRKTPNTVKFQVYFIITHKWSNFSSLSSFTFPPAKKNQFVKGSACHGEHHPKAGLGKQDLKLKNRFIVENL